MDCQPEHRLAGGWEMSVAQKKQKNNCEGVTAQIIASSYYRKLNFPFWLVFIF